MDKEIGNELDKQLVQAIKEMDNYEAGSDEWCAVADRIDKLYQRRQEDSKAKNSWAIEIIKAALGAGGSLVSALFFWCLTNNMFRFEETGSIGAKASNLILNKIKFKL
jgi:hypothetical protein